MRNNKGITMISLVITIIVLLILTSITVHNGLVQMKIKRVNNLYADIDSLSTKVAEYYLKNKTIPIYNEPYVENKDELKAILISNGATETANLINVNDEGAYYVLDLSKLDNLTLNYGDDYKTWNLSEPKSQNVYIINPVTHQIYFPRGVRSGDEYYFARFPDDNEVSPITLEETENEIGIVIVKKSYIKIDSAKEYISAEIIVSSDEEYQTSSLKYAWTDTYNEEIFDTIEFTNFALDSDNKATLSSLPLDKSTDSHYLLIKAIDNNGNLIKGMKEIEKKVYAILYSNNSDNTDLELVFNSTGKFDETRNRILEPIEITLASYNSAGARPWKSYISNIKTATIEDQIFPKYMKYWFNGCTALTQINGIENIDTSNVSLMNYLFTGCSGLTSLDVSGFDTSKVTDMQNLFNGCSGLTSLDVSRFDTSQVTNMGNMFYGCNNITTIYAGDNWNVDNVTNSTNMFYGCTNVMGDIAFNSSYLDKTYAKTTGGYLTYKASPAP